MLGKIDGNLALKQKHVAKIRCCQHHAEKNKLQGVTGKAGDALHPRRLPPVSYSGSSSSGCPWGVSLWSLAASCSTFAAGRKLEESHWKAADSMILGLNG